ncbi:LysR family transcriptional regulator [Massilia sp. CF038]|uniref:LysR family transcriptional regulator n=1 Tax=Massilia sp. CF038 TaxID=1881045 RepID=UPI0009126C5F|nr:LysR family transcriptional regulator [Massilia sp. CF038]SHH71571.1 transcriptional regulator, LysR family [Massilia sp. CF038]
MDRVTAARVFVVISERGSMIAAADALDMSRAMVTRYLAQMEQWAHARLFHRSTRRLSLTDAGEQALVRCRALLALADAMPDSGAAGAQPHGLLRMSCSPSLGQAVMARIVTAFLQQHAQARVDLQMTNQAVNLVEDRIDLAIRITNALDPNLIARRLADCDSVVCAAPAYLAAHGTPSRLEDLTRHNCLTFTHFGKHLWQFTRDGQAEAIPVSGNLSANDPLVLLAATQAGAGIALQPRYSAMGPIARGELVELLPQFAPQALGIYGVYGSRQHMSALLRAMLDFQLAWFAGQPGWQNSAP